jgi:superfamily II DNA or RNA helicase
MVKYPTDDDPDFGQKITKLYKKYKIEKSNPSMKQICFPKRFKLQKPQIFVSEYINPKTPYNGLLVYHGIGSGKTCSAVRIAEEWKHKRKIMVVVPASLIGNFKKELRSECAGETYLTKKESNLLDKLNPSDNKYIEIIKKSDKRIDKYYEILSYHGYIGLYDDKKLKLDNKLLIIDEVQNMISESGSFYKKLYDSVKKAKNLKIVLLSATPIFDKLVEFGLTMNLILPKHREFPIITSEFNKMFIKQKKYKSGKVKFTVKNKNKLKNKIRGYVSYFKGAPPNAFPKVNIIIKKTKMSSFQFKSYSIVAKNEGAINLDNEENIYGLPNNFYMGTRMTSNIAFPSRTINEAGLKSLTQTNMRNLDRYSCKFYKMMKIIRKSIKEKGSGIFIYSNFLKYGGLHTFAKVLRFYGFKDFEKYGPGEKRYVILSGETNKDMKYNIISTYNKPENMNGSLIKIVMGSPAVKEGISLLNTNTALIIDEHFNLSRMMQVSGRVVRFCSHKLLPRDKRYVDIYYFRAVYPNYYTVDEYIADLAKKKQDLIDEFQHTIKEIAIDCRLNKAANVHKDDKDIECE